MMQSSNFTVYKLNQASNEIGGKAKGLKFLYAKKFRVPYTLVIPYSIYNKWIKNHNITDLLKDQLFNLIDLEKEYIIRSSASLEDSTEHSYAGQFETVTSVKGIEQIIGAIISVWKSTNRADNYSTTKNIQEEIQIAVIIQEQIKPEVSGVVFTRNPLNGIEETIIEAISGSSEKILQEGLDPDRWIYRWGKFINSPVTSEIDENIISDVANQSKEIEKKFGSPIDLEWVYSDGKIWWIQLREITTIDEVDYFSNRISSEQLPGLIKPLIWSINIPMVCGAWKKLVEEILGKTKLEAQNMASQFYYRAYYNMSELGKAFEKIGIPRDSLELMMDGSSEKSIKPKPPLHLFPRIIKFVIQKTFFEKNLEKQIEEAKKKYNKFKIKTTVSPEEAITIIDNLFDYNSKAAYYVIVIQMLHTIFYNMLKKKAEENGLDLKESFFQNQTDDINPNTALQKLSNLRNKEDISLGNLNESKEFKAFIEKFGHLSESGNDFSEPTWAELPEHVVQLIEFHHEGQYDPHIPSDTPGLEKWWLFKKTKRLYYLREYVSFYYTKNYTLFREYFLVIANHLISKDVIDDSEDIFYLKYEEIKKIIENKDYRSRMKRINHIKKEMMIYREITPPNEIYGLEEPPIPMEEKTSFLSGVPASKGYFRGIVKHMKKLDLSMKIIADNVVVIPYSDISWIPFLAKAGAIISESGGILSHAAVIAREYKIPAVLGVKNAFQIEEDSKVIVNGYTGEITIIDTSV